MHQGITPLDCYWLSLVAEVDQFEGETTYESAVDLCGVKKGKPHSAILTLGSEMRHKFRRGKHDLVGDKVLVFQIMESPFLLYRENITISVKKPIVKWMNAPVSLNQANQLVLANHAHNKSLV